MLSAAKHLYPAVSDGICGLTPSAPATTISFDPLERPKGGAAMAKMHQATLQADGNKFAIVISRFN